MMAPKPTATKQKANKELEHDLDLAYRFLIPSLGGRNLTPKDEREGRRAISRLLSAERGLDRGLRRMLAAVFDPDPFQFDQNDPDGLITGYAWLASERTVELKFRKRRRTPPIRYILIGSMIAQHLREHRADIARREPGEISVERAIRDVANVIGVGEETAWDEWGRFLDFVRRRRGRRGNFKASKLP
jgi:hypothetical protein